MRRHPEQGFTLIEILVVVLIVGITLGFAVLAFGDFGQSRRIIMRAEELANTIRLAESRAILESSTLGILLEPNTWQVVVFEPDKGWKRIRKRTFFRPHMLSGNTRVRFRKSKAQAPGIPRIIIYPSGEITAFVMDMGTDRQPVLVTISGQENGMVTVQTTGNPS